MATDSLAAASGDDLPRSGATGNSKASASPELTGGAGFTFEDSVASVYAAALLSETTAPGLPGRLVKCLSVQQGAMGHPLDDLIVEGEGNDGVRMRLSLQVKRHLGISCAATNTDFRDTVLRAYATVTGAGFNVSVDRVGAVVGEIADASKRSFETLCEWARADSDSAGFVAKLRTEGVAGQKQTHFDDVRAILSSAVPEDGVDAATWLLLSHFVLMRLEMLHEGSVTEATTVASLSNCLHPADRARVDDLWRRLLALVRLAEGQAAVFDRKTLVARLNGAFRLNGAPSLQEALAQISAEAGLAAAEISNTIAGVSVPRERFVQASREALTRYRFVQIGGSPGAGKSVVLRSLLDDALANGPALFLKADRLTGATWSQHAASSGFGRGALEDLLVELAATGSSTVFVDGLDRVEVRHRAVVLDVFNTMLDSPLLKELRVLATVRDTGIEPVRTWLPSRLFDGGAQVIHVEGFDDAEATLLAGEQQALAPLLFGSEQVRAIARRPFFAAVLIKRRATETTVPSSEIELATAWWAGGGYGAEAARAGQLRNTLVQLAQAGAAALGRRIPALGLDPQALAELEADGIIRDVRVGQTVRFVHDIYFEWSFLQLLVSKGEQWLEVIRQVGEPPVLGRVVELLSQGELKDGQDWQKYLARLETTTDARSQWMRAWMLGPFGLPGFRACESTYDAAMLGDGARRVAKLAVWFQAEKTKANPIALDNNIFPNLELTQRLLFGDSMALPSDIEPWRRFCGWLIRHIDRIPVSTRPEVLAVFEVWQNIAADVANRISALILDLVKSWLDDIEARFHARGFPKDYGEWDQLEGGVAEDFESRLRAMFLRAGRAYPTMVGEYLIALQSAERMPRSAMEQVLLHSSILSEVCPSQLVDLALHVMIRPLPEEHARRSSGSSFGHGIVSHDWQSLSIDDQNAYFPCAPTRAPFPSLFSNAPDEARRLVRQFANHAIKAWRQLHQLDHERRGTPLPLMLTFPWGEQTFWGEAQQFVWSRGTWGSHVVGSGLIALEAWAFKEVEKGRPVDEVLTDVLEGHEGVGALGVAVALTLHTKHCSETTLSLFTSQRLWAWDIARRINDMGSPSNLIGFRPADRHHYEAVVATNKRQCRQTELRWLASVCVLMGGDLASRASEAIMTFPDNLPFDYEEERADPGQVEHLRRTAEIWAEVGKRENYRATRAEDGKGVVVQMENPKAQGPDIDAINQRQAEMMEHFRLLNWAHSSFDKHALADELTVDGALRDAKRLDATALFEVAHQHVSPSHQRQAAVAGVAAVVLQLGQNVSPQDFDWAADVCLRAWTTPEAQNDLFFRGSILLHHPVLYGCRGLAALLRHDTFRRGALEALLQLTAHPYEQVVGEALSGLLAVWDERPEIAWLALKLAISLALVERPAYDAPSDQREEQEHQRVESAVLAALDQCATLSEPPSPLPSMPPAWVATSGEPQFVRGRRGRDVLVEWEHPATDLHGTFLAKVLSDVPVPTVMADESRRGLFLSWCDGLVEWTIERLCPTWSRADGQEPVDVASTELFEWRRALYTFLARVSLHLEPETSVRRFFEPAANTDDETFGSLSESYVACLTSNVMDEPTISPGPLATLSAIVPRLLSHRSWQRSARTGRTLHDAELSQMIRMMFFVNIERAMGAARFANGNWSDVAVILPLVEPILVAHGDNPTVATAFLTLCERAFESYPVDRFVTQLPMVLRRTEGLPLGWRGTSLAARLAGLIQRFSQKTQPLPPSMARDLLRALDALVDMGDRRAAAVQTSEIFKDVRVDGVVS